MYISSSFYPPHLFREYFLPQLSRAKLNCPDIVRMHLSNKNIINSLVFITLDLRKVSFLEVSIWQYNIIVKNAAIAFHNLAGVKKKKKEIKINAN